MKIQNKYSSLYLLKKIAERLQDQDLSHFERVALKSRYSDLVEEIREKASR